MADIKNVVNKMVSAVSCKFDGKKRYEFVDKKIQCTGLCYFEDVSLLEIYNS
jgi:hypothetical protein